MTLPETNSDVTTYGMPQTPVVGWQNYGGIPVTDPTTDQDASAFNQMTADAAQMTRTAARAMLMFTTAASTGAVVLVSHDAMWGNGAPVAPVVSRLGLGQFQWTWPATVIDPLGATRTVNFKNYCHSQIDGGASLTGFASIQKTAANVAVVYVFSTAFSPSDLVGTNVKVWMY